MQNYFRLLRLDKPIGTLLLLWPTWWALWIAYDGIPNVGVLFAFSAGVFLTRSAVRTYCGFWHTIRFMPWWICLTI